MAGITIKEYGLTFVWACLKEYLGSSWPILLLFALGIIVGICMALMKWLTNRQAGVGGGVRA